MQPVAIRITLSRQASDGNYGSERAEVSLEAQLDKEDNAVAAADELFAMARDSMQTALGRSPAFPVRRAMVRQEPAGRPEFDDGH